MSSIPTYAISLDIQETLSQRVRRYNRAHKTTYALDIRGKFIYLLHMIDDKTFEKDLGRLRYTGDIEDMTFAIYKYSSGKYDEDESDFPGSEYLDGTIEGAMKAVSEAYL